ncbi:hypothetical protein F4860DRAFT_343625 [Xylaria cubensis]|nr:hypothetical protein F4860DRAFT_343625 [Xylaria cubensis]
MTVHLLGRHHRILYGRQQPLNQQQRPLSPVARITNGHENPFVNAQGTANHYTPEVKHQQFNTAIPLTRRELAEATSDHRAFAVHKTTGTSCDPAGTYLVYRLRHSESGTRNLNFEAIWDWGNGFVGKASYDFVSLTACDDYAIKSYATIPCSYPEG